MRVCVDGLWHLGSVTAACLAEHFDTTGFDPDSRVVRELEAGNPPISEPGLQELIRQGLASGKLRFTADRAGAISDADVLWVTFDTPVDENDVADVAYVAGQVALTFPCLKDGALVLISSQVPAGFCRNMETRFRTTYPERCARFACSPENLRLGKALDVFRHPDRIIAGIRDDESRTILTELFSPFTDRVEWMRVESAEMTKHALNAFLATSVTFINEIAAICEKTGADAKEVERGLKSEMRIGPKAYLGPGGSFAGGTLARDIAFLTDLAHKNDLPVALIPAVRTSNDAHKNWPRRTLDEALDGVSGKTIAVLGLTYKPGTDTLRRSSAIELCKWIVSNGGRVRAFDPAVRSIASEGVAVELCTSAQDAIDHTDAAVISTEWPEFRALAGEDFIRRMAKPIVIDANRFLAKQLELTPQINYIAVGKYQEPS